MFYLRDKANIRSDNVVGLTLLYYYYIIISFTTIIIISYNRNIHNCTHFVTHQ